MFVPDFQFLQMVGYVFLLCTSCTHIPMDSLAVVKTVHIITAYDCSEAAATRNYEALIFQYETSIINLTEVRCIMKFPTRSR